LLKWTLSSFGIDQDRGNQRSSSDSTAGRPVGVTNCERPFTFREVCLVGSPTRLIFCVLWCTSELVLVCWIFLWIRNVKADQVIRQVDT